jgi:D-alanyl-lipoteichoic acid acyltransferase DltB (MBOAT superfamily)
MALMFNFCRVTALVCCVRDGLVLKRKGKDNCRLKSREIEYAVTDGIPSFFDYWAYMYFCGGSISGPFYEYNDWMNFIRREKQYKNIPSTVWPTCKRILLSFVFIALQSLLQPFNLKVFGTPAYLEAGFAWRAMICFLSWKFKIFTYIIGFMFMDSGPIACGFAYNGTEEVNGKQRHLWNRVQSIELRKFYSGKGGLGHLIAFWNMSV